MAAELIRPGVEVIQSLSTPAPSFVRPTLVPCVLGAAYEVINVLNDDGTINSKALFGPYAQLPLSITESSFPDPRNNIDELDVLEEKVRPFMLAGGKLGELPIRPTGGAFLAASHGASAAAIRSGVFSGATGLALNGTVLVIAVDQPVRLDTSKDVTITFVGAGNLTSQQAADQVNAAVGKTVAFVNGTAPSDKLELRSPTYGAGSSITVRAGGSANAVLTLAITGSEERVEGSGFRGQDDLDNDDTTPWIEFYVGAYILAGTVTSFAAKAGLYNIVTNTFTSATASAVTFGSSGNLVIQVGDFMVADGVQVKSGEIAKIEINRFKIGTVNPTLSTADEDGNYTTKVYDIQEVNTPLSDAPFEPGHVWFRANGLNWKTAAPTAATLLGGATGSAATHGVITGTTAGAGPFALAGLRIHYVVTIDGVDTDASFTFTGGPFANAAAVETAIGTNIPGVTVSDDGGSPPQFIFTTVKTGRLQTIRFKADGTANAVLGFSTSVDTVSSGTDVVFAGISGKSLVFSLDNNPHLYTATFSDTSLDLAIIEINNAVGFTVASKGGSNNKLLLTSPLKGIGSAVAITLQSPTGAEVLFKLDSADSPTPTAVAGTGRPLPDAYLDDASVLHIQADVTRDPVTGFPLDQTFNTNTLYIQYKALRKDVTAVAKIAGVLRISDTKTLGTVLNPVTEDNPLALGLFLAMINAPNFEVKGLGVDEVSAAAPDGTSLAWARAAGMLETEEVYAIAPLSQDEVVRGLWVTHATVMSEPEQGGERIVFLNAPIPTRQNPAIALSGTQANSTGTNNQMLLDGNPASGLIAAGVNPSLPIPESAEVYLEFEVAGELRRYSVSSVTGALVNLRVTFTSSINADGFYSTVPLNVTVINAAYALDVRGVSMIIPGSNPARLDYSQVASAVSDSNAGIKSRRAYSVFPDTIKTTVQGLEKSLPGYYACAAIAGMVGAQPPQQGFTNFPVTGITGVVGTEKFSKAQLGVMRGGGTYILSQDAPGGPVTSMHQLSTDLTSIETRELSITKVVDFVAKFLRLGIRKYIGTQNINDQLLDTLGSTIHAILQFLEEAGVLNGSNLNNIAQDPNAPDTVLIDVTLDVPFPCNYIRLTLVV